MKKQYFLAFTRRTDIKTIFIILLTISVWVSAMSSMSVLVLAEHNAYSNEGAGVLEEILDNLLERDANAIWQRMNRRGTWTGIPAQRIELEQELNLRFDPKDSNLRYAIYGAADGELLFGDRSVTEHTARYCQEYTITKESQLQTAVYQISDTDSALALVRQSREDEDNLLLQIDWQEKEDGTVLLKVSTCPVFRYRICLSVDKELTALDKYGLAERLAVFLAKNRFLILFFAVFSFVLTLFLLSLLILGAGKKPDSDLVHLLPWDKAPFDLYFLGMCFLIFLPNIISLLFPDLRWTYLTDLIFQVAFNALVVLYRTVLGFCIIMTGARRFKNGTILKNTLIYRFLRYIDNSICKVPWGREFYFRMVGIALVFSLLELMLLLFAGRTVLIWVWAGEKLLLGAALAVVVANLGVLEHGGSALKDGDVSEKIDTSRLLPLFRKHGETLNGISVGMKKTLDEQTRSERMKTELIANVSHDLKTPLTSIINYVDLLKKAGTDSESAGEYLDVLDRQAVRLKKLVVDLIDASKASSGSIAYEPERLDLNLLLSQAAGEYAERMEEIGQQQIVSLSSEPLMVQADPEHLWRIFDNLLRNAMLYSQKDSRIYISTEKVDCDAVVLFRNISSERLNISPDELMERFVRGDSSRNTEGSGLGLSIVRSLTELQGGSFSIVIDGDLFKAILHFPLV